MILVLDSSALIALARIGRLNLLQQLAREVYIPEAVHTEVTERGQGRIGSVEVRQAPWLAVTRVQDQAEVSRLRAQVGRGEAEAIILAREIQADFVVLDDATARRLAVDLGARVVGVLGLLLYAKQLGKIAAVKPLFDELRTAGFFIDESLYHLLLRQAGEETT